jgi:hypothetical protein
MLLASMTPGRADVRYVVQRSSIQAPDDKNPYAPRRVDRMTYEVCAQPGRRRVDETLLSTTARLHLARIVLGEQNQVIRLSPELRLFTLDHLQPGDLSNLQGPPLTATAPGKSGTRQVTWHISEVGHDVISGQTTTHYRLEQSIHDSGCLGERNYNATSDVWCVELPGLGGGVAPLPATWTQTDDRDHVITIENVGDLELLQKISRAAVLRQHTQSGRDEIAAQELVNISTAPLDYALFLKPAGYREVSRGDFDRAIEQFLLHSTVRTGP